MLLFQAFLRIAIFWLVSGTPSADFTKSWSAGKTAWKAARDPATWDKPNACDPTVLHSSAPLTVLFGLSSVWEKIQHKRKEGGRGGQPLEIHVLGASYPFEGRSDWSLIAKHRPEEIPQVRVRLILGTPFQSDNVPPLANQPNSLLEVSSRISPTAGRWSTKQNEIICKGEGKYGTKEIDQAWSKADLCRDHGNGFEVVCIEKFYQDVQNELPKPDLAVMFSPGFPQLNRRTWDGVLIELLNNEVHTMISDVVSLPSWGYGLKLPGKPAKVLPGGKWPVSARLGEDGQTWLAMKKYGAHMLKARRGPFPILHKEDGEVLAKNAVIQIYEGYKPQKKPTQPLPVAHIERYNKLFNNVNWDRLASDECPREMLTHAFKYPTSKPFDHAVRDLYITDLRRQAHKRQSSFTSKERAELEKYGLLGSESKTGKRKHWGLNAWVTVLRVLGCGESGIDI